MLNGVQFFLNKLSDLLAVTKPTIKVEMIDGTGGPYGAIFRLSGYPSGEHRDIYVFSRWERNEKTGRKTSVRDLASPQTGYTKVIGVDYTKPGMRGAPTVIYDRFTKEERKAFRKLTYKDHETLVAFFEKAAQQPLPDGLDFDRRLVRLYQTEADAAPKKPRRRTPKIKEAFASNL